MLHALVKVQVSSGIVKSLVMLPMHTCSTPYKHEVYLYYLCQEGENVKVCFDKYFS